MFVLLDKLTQVFKICLNSAIIETTIIWIEPLFYEKKVKTSQYTVYFLSNDFFKCMKQVRACVANNLCFL